MEIRKFGGTPKLLTRRQAWFREWTLWSLLHLLLILSTFALAVAGGQSLYSWTGLVLRLPYANYCLASVRQHHSSIPIPADIPVFIEGNMHRSRLLWHSGRSAVPSTTVVVSHTRTMVRTSTSFGCISRVRDFPDLAFRAVADGGESIRLVFWGAS